MSMVVYLLEPRSWRALVRVEILWCGYNFKIAFKRFWKTTRQGIRLVLSTTTPPVISATGFREFAGASTTLIFYWVERNRGRHNQLCTYVGWFLQAFSQSENFFSTFERFVLRLVTSQFRGCMSTISLDLLSSLHQFRFILASCSLWARRID